MLEVNLQAARDRFQVGDLTRTDVAQSEARLAIARSQLRDRAGAADFEQGKLYPLRRHAAGRARRSARAAEPAGLARCRGRCRAASNNPNLLAAVRAGDATRYDVSAARASRLPTLSGVVGGNYFNYLGSFGTGTNPKPGQTGTSGTVGAADHLAALSGRAALGADPPGAGTPRPGAGDGDRYRTRGHRADAVGLCDLALVARSDRVGAARGRGEQIEPGGRPRRKQRRQPHDPRHPQRRAGIAQQPGDVGDRAARRVCRWLRVAVGDGPGGGARPGARRRCALRSADQL